MEEIESGNAIPSQNTCNEALGAGRPVNTHFTDRASRSNNESQRKRTCTHRRQTVQRMASILKTRRGSDGFPVAFGSNACVHERERVEPDRRPLNSLGGTVLPSRKFRLRIRPILRCTRVALDPVAGGAFEPLSPPGVPHSNVPHSNVPHSKVTPQHVRAGTMQVPD